MVVGAIALAPAVLAGAAAASVQITVKPETGSTHTKFVVSFIAPESTSTASTNRSYEVSASRSPRKGCLSSVLQPVDSAIAGKRVRVTLAPGSSRSWCAGPYKGVVKETVRPNCSAGTVCPQYIAILTVGTFAFRVR